MLRVRGRLDISLAEAVDLSAAACLPYHKEEKRNHKNDYDYRRNKVVKPRVILNFVILHFERSIRVRGVVFLAVIFRTRLNFVEENSNVRNNVIDELFRSVIECNGHTELARAEVEVVFAYLIIVKVAHNIGIAVFRNGFSSLLHKCNDKYHCRKKHPDIDKQSPV